MKVCVSFVKSAVVATTFALLGAGCTSTKPQTEPKIAINIDSPDSPFWFTFAVMSSDCAKRYQPYSFGEFYCSISLANMLNSGGMRETSGNVKPTRFMQALSLVTKAGYFKEYVFNQYHQPNWFLEPGLKQAEYENWMAKALPQHKASLPQDNVSIVREDPKDEESKAAKPVTLGADFIKESGIIYLAQQKQFDDPYMGLVLRYVDDANPDFYADVFVYRKRPYKDRPFERSYLIDEMSLVKALMLYYVDKGDFSDFKVIDEEVLNNGEVVAGVYQMNQFNRPVESLTFITEQDDVMVKVRSSYAIDNTEQYREDIKAVMVDIKSHIID